MGATALSIGADTFQFFTRNPRGSRAKALVQADYDAVLGVMKEHRFGPVLGHAAYTLNPASADPVLRGCARRDMADDLRRMERLPGNLYNVHPGSHRGRGPAEGVRSVAELLEQVIHSGQTTTVLLETMSGKGAELGGRFEELRDIIAGVSAQDKVGVCLDTCHVHDAGYDIVNDLDGVLEEFDRVIGLEHLRAVHLNDSKNPRGSRKDRHERLGRGCIGFDALLRVVLHPKLEHLPFVLETPNEVPGYAGEIEQLRDAVRKKTGVASQEGG